MSQQLPSILYVERNGKLCNELKQPVAKLKESDVNILFNGNPLQTIGGVTYRVTVVSPDLLKLDANTKVQSTSLESLVPYLSQYGTLNINAVTGVINTTQEVNVGSLSQDILSTLRESPRALTIDGKQFTLAVSHNQITIQPTTTRIDSLMELINFGLENAVSNITINNSASYYRKDGKLYKLDTIYSEKHIARLINGYDNNLTATLDTQHAYHSTKTYNNKTVSLHILKDNVYTIVIDFLTSDDHVVTDFFDAEWLEFVKTYNRRDKGSIIVVSEKQDMPEILPLMLDAITFDTDIITSYNKTIVGTNTDILNFSSDVPFKDVAKITADICILDFNEAIKDWDTVFSLTDNKTLVVLVVSESSIYMTLSMITETFSKQYIFRKFIELLLGISVVSLKRENNFDKYIVSYDYVYNNAQFKTLIGSKVFNKFELEDKKYKHYYFNINGQRKDTESTLHDILKHANEIKAHDICLVAGYPPGFRKGRDIVFTLTDEILKPFMTESIFMAIVKDQRQREKLKEIKGDGIAVSYSVPGIGRYRVNIYNQRGSISLSMRKIPDEIPTMEWCGVPESIQHLFRTAKQGLILVTGPTGSGKSTTLASGINERNMNHKEHIITIEDPIEYLYPKGLGVLEQIEFGTDTLSFLLSMKSNMRNNPDIIEIGEIRDAEVLGVALNATVTGHLVVSTLHTRGAVETVQRTIDMTPTGDRENIKSLLSQNLLATVTQQLLPSVDGGMVCAHEVMIVNPAIKSAISEGTPQSIQSIYQSLTSGVKDGMQDMDRAIANLWREGKISQETAQEYAPNFNRVVQIYKSVQ